MSRCRLSLCSMLALVLAAPVHACTPSQLFILIGERLSLMPAVAAYKYQRGLPVTDAARERRVEDVTSQQARELGIPPAQVLPLIRAQMEAAKAIQRDLMQQWTRQGRRSDRESGATTDLTTSIRPRLIQLGHMQLETLQCLRESGWRIAPGDRQSFDQHTAGTHLPGHAADALFQALLFAGK